MNTLYETLTTYRDREKLFYLMQLSLCEEANLKDRFFADDVIKEVKHFAKQGVKVRLK